MPRNNYLWRLLSIANRQNAFRDAFFMAWSAANRGGAKVLAGDVDKQLKLDRAASARAKTEVLSNLPDGVIVKQKSTSTYFLIRNAKLYPWSFDGYGDGQ